MYNKLFSKILDSSIWLESAPTRLVWLTFIAVMDQDGLVQFAAPANVAHRARVTLEEAEEALRVLESPDPNSSNPANLGRRIERVPGGWVVLNAKAHRDVMTRAIQRHQTAERVRKHRAMTHGNAKVTHVTQRAENVTPSEAEAVSESDTESKAKAPPPPRAREEFLSRVANATAWRHRFDAWLAGVGWHNGAALRSDDLESGLSDYLLAEAEPDFGPRHVKRFIEKAEQDRRARDAETTTGNNGAGPKSRARRRDEQMAAIDRGIDAVLRPDQGAQ